MKTCIFKDSDIFPIYPVTIDSKEKQVDIVRPLGMNTHQIFVVSDGTGVLKIENAEEEVVKGDMFFIKKGVGHSYMGDENFKTTYLGFDGELCNNIFNYFGVNRCDINSKKEKSNIVFRNKDYETIEMLISDFWEEFESVGESAKLSAQTYLIVTTFFCETQKSEIKPIEKVKNYLNANYAKPINLDDIMQIYPYSKAKLCRDFLSQYHMSIFEMLTKIRLSHSRIMLKSAPHITLKDVAKNCGFNDVSYFCKMYKKAYGISPKKSVLK